MIKKLFALVVILFTPTFTFASLYELWATQEIVVPNGIKVIDIRTEAEWVETGIIKGSYTITFFDEKGKFDMQSFLEELNQIVKKDFPFAIICRVGSRSGMLAPFLANRLGYEVINLKGGILKLIKDGYKTTPYRK